MIFRSLSAPRIYNFSDFFGCTTPHPSTIQRTGVFSKWLFSTNKFLYVNTTQNVYEHVKKINFVACGLFSRGIFRFLKIARDTTSYCSPRVNSGLFFIVGNRPLDSFAGITAAIPAPFSEKKYYSAVYVWVSLCARLQQNSSVSLEFKFMDFKF